MCPIVLPARGAPGGVVLESGLIDMALMDDKMTGFLELVGRYHNSSIQVVGEGGKILASYSGEVGLEDGARYERPLAVRGENVGVVYMGIPPGDEREVADAARMIGIYVESLLDAEYHIDSLAGEVVERYEEINLLYDLSQDLGELLNERQISRRVLRRLEAILSAYCIAILLREEPDAFRVSAAAGSRRHCTDTVIREGNTVAGDEGVLRDLVEKRKAILVTDREMLAREADRFGLARPVRSLLLVPLIRPSDRNDEFLQGALLLIEKEGGRVFTSGDRKLITTVAGQAASAIYNCRLVEQLRHATRMRRDIELAREIQAALLPNEPPRVEGIQLAGRCETAHNVGGDYFDYVPGRNGSVNLFLGDVTGHNIGAALLMTAVRATLITSASESTQPGVVLEKANRLLYKDLSSSNMMVSLFAARFMPEKRRLLFSNAGHNPPLLLRRGTDWVDYLDAEGLIVGVLEEVEYEIGMRDLNPGDIVLFFTDGVVEARSENGETFGDERLEKVLCENREKDAGEILDEIFHAVNRYTGIGPRKDDITVMVLKVND